MDTFNINFVLNILSLYKDYFHIFYLKNNYFHNCIFNAKQEIINSTILLLLLILWNFIIELIYKIFYICFEQNILSFVLNYLEKNIHLTDLYKYVPILY